MLFPSQLPCSQLPCRVSRWRPHVQSCRLRLNLARYDCPMVAFNLYFLYQQVGDCLQDPDTGAGVGSDDRSLRCNITQRTVLVLLLSLGMSAVLLGYKVSHLPQLQSIWSEKRELNWKRKLLAADIHTSEELPMPLRTPRTRAKPVRTNK